MKTSTAPAACRTRTSPGTRVMLELKHHEEIQHHDHGESGRNSQMSGGAGDAIGRKVRDRHAGKIRPVRHMVVDRRQRAACSVAKERPLPGFRRSRVKYDPEVDRFLQLWRDAGQHRERSRDMEPADDIIDAACTELPREVHGTRILVGLHADHSDQASAGCRNVVCDALRANSDVGFVDVI
jgi:hypothetical protein